MYYHSFNLENENIIGQLSIECLDNKWKLFNFDNLSNKIFGDFGCWDGYFAFKAIEAGVSKAICIDNGMHSKKEWKSNIEYIANKKKVNNIVVVDEDLLSDNVLSHKVDIGLCSGVLYHTQHVYKLLENLYQIVNDYIILETHVTCNDLNFPMMKFYQKDELNKDKTNWWGPNNKCVIAMLESVGFNNVKCTYLSHEHKSHLEMTQRAFFRAEK